MSDPKVTPSQLRRSAVVYVRQSTLAQVERNRESTARQYDLVARAVSLVLRPLLEGEPDPGLPKLNPVLLRELEPKAAAFENLFYATNVQSALKLGHVRGVSMFAAAEANLPVFEYSPLEVKSAVTGYGRAEKSQVQQMVRALLKLNMTPEPYDASDALAVAICHAHTDRFNKSLVTHL